MKWIRQLGHRRSLAWVVRSGVVAGVWLGTLSCASRMGPPRAYDLEVEGVPGRSLTRSARQVTEAEANRTVPVAGLSALERRVQPDTEVMRRYLRARGFFGAEVTVRVEDGRRRPQVVFTATNLVAFTVTNVQVVVTGGEVTATSALAGARAEFNEIRADERSIRRQVMRKGFPLARISQRRIEADHATGHVSVWFEVEAGPRADFGPVDISGLNHVNTAFVRNLIPWNEGDRYRVDDVEELRRRLAETGLFSMIDVAGAGVVDEAGRYPFSIGLVERRRQTVQVGLAYRTDQGGEASAGWSFRNLRGHGEHLEVKGLWSEEGYDAGVGLELPQFRHPRQSLTLKLSVDEERPDAYRSQSVRASAMVDRELSRRVRLQPGLTFRVSEIDEVDREEDFILLSAPVGLIWSTRDDLLDPRRGHHFEGVVEPFYDLADGAMGFVKSRMTEQIYKGLNRDRTVVLAGRFTFGSIVGAGVASVPADERFYAGGGASVRGYKYQSIGPRRGDRPSGGRSLLETSGELRYRMTRSFGAVVFLDGGAVFEEAMADFSETFRWGAGAGIRYFTGFGPIRADIGFPVNPSPGESTSPEFYISIGQAF